MRFNRRDVIFFLLSAFLVLLYVLMADGGFPLDDSWIHQVYARNLGDHAEWAFVSGEPSAASTSPFYTVLLSVGYFLNIPHPLWTHLLGVLALSFTGMLGARISLKILPDNHVAAWMTGLVLILSWHLIWAAASGMETMLIGMFTLLLIDQTWVGFTHPTMQHGVFLGILAAMAMMTRPEGALLGGLCGLALLLIHKQKLLLWGVGAVCGFGVAIAPYLWLNLDLAGGLLPATSEAKYAQLAPFLEQPYLRRFLGMALPLAAGGQLLLIPGMVFFVGQRLQHFNQRHEIVIELLPVLWAIALIMLYAARLPASYQHGRYVIPALPSLLVVGVAGTFTLYNQNQRRVLGRIMTRSVVISVGLTFLYFGLVIGSNAYTKDVQIIDEEMVDPAHWIAENISTDELVATHDIGALGYFAPRPLVDIAGLVTHEVVPLISNDDALWRYLQERDARYLMAFPDQIPGENPKDERLCPLYQSDGTTAPEAGGSKMIVYRISWNGDCQ